MKGKWVKLLAVLACLTLTAGVVACGDKGDGGNGNSSLPEISSSVESSSEEVVDSSSEESVESSSEESSSESSKEEYPEDYYTEGLVFTLQDDDTYAVTGYTGTARKVVIPSVYQGVPVTSIGDWAFSSCDSLTEIVISDSVTNIGRSAFRFCDGLTSVTFGENSQLTSIGNDAFWRCWTLTEIIIPDSVTSIAWYAFAHCYSLTEIVIPEGVTSISGCMFYYCGSLTEIVIPDGVTRIHTGAFIGCDSLTEIVIPNGVTSIGEEVFSSCDNLTIYCETESQPSGWHNDWNSYSSVNECPVVWDCNNNEVADDRYIYAVINGIRYGLKDGEAKVVGQPSNITSANISATVEYKGVEYLVTSIGGRAFEDCYSLTDIVIPDSVTSIGWNAFSSCDSLTEIVIPDSVTSIGWNAFDHCNNLTVYCEAESQPSGWDRYWNPRSRPVVWGYTGE